MTNEKVRDGEMKDGAQSVSTVAKPSVANVANSVKTHRMDTMEPFEMTERCNNFSGTRSRRGLASEPINRKLELLENSG